MLSVVLLLARGAAAQEEPEHLGRAEHRIS
jgi:hypothetical protein